MPRGSRLAIWCLALLLSLSLYLKGRVATVKGVDAALFRAVPGTITVRLAGDFPHPGLYRFPDALLATTAIKMTLPDAPLAVALPGRSDRRLAAGDVVTLRLGPGKTAVFSLSRMPVKERMLLRIPLDPDLLGPEEWDCLPGIGPVLSARITADRQKYGAFGALQGVLRVPGVGAGKINLISKYF
jgi:competence protein ComEA